MNKNKKQLKDVKWETVALEGFPISAGDKLHSFVGLEECTDYDFDKNNKKTKKSKKPAKKRKIDAELPRTVVPTKKVKLSNGFIVENSTTVGPSLTNEESNKKRTKKAKNNKKKGLKPTEQIKEAELPLPPSSKKNKPKLGESIGEKQTDLTPEDMLSWAEFKLPEPILKALMELGFKKPTKIQQLSLPAAIHGRRDILGAAETGSGKTLAFGLPILTGILKLKEKAAKGFDPYDLPFKKTSNKKKQTNIEVKNNNNNKSNKKRSNSKKPETKTKESSEDGYSSGDETFTDDDDKETKDKPKQSIKTAPKKDNDEDFIEEIDVPIRKKREPSEDEGNDSDDDDNYIHLSDMLDSDDLADNSSEDEDEQSDKVDESDDNDKNASEDESSENDVEEQMEDELSENEDDVEEEELSENDGNGESEGENSEHDENMQGIGCVKVIDNVEMPQPTMVKTGKPLYALILTPTRELAIQISRHLIAVAKYTGIRIATIVGGMAAVKQERVLKSGPEIVVATPGRLWELLSQGQPHLQQLESVKFLAIDETDRMVERAHFLELHPLLERLNADGGRRARRQNFVFSATLTLVHDLPTHLMGKKVTKRGKIINRKVQKMTPAQKVNKLVRMVGMTEPKVVDITQDNSGTAENLTESRITCAFEHKDAYLYYILTRHPGRTIVFCNSIGCVQRLSQLLSILQCRPLPLHASMAQRQRLKNLERFRDDPRGVLVATDVAARGLDIPDVDHVIHYQVPKTAENYVHRSGRTARASKEGLTILMVEPAEGSLYAKLCRTLNRTTELPLFPVPASSLAPFKDILSVAREIDSLELKRRRASQATGWRDKAAREMDMIIDEDDCPVTQIAPSLSRALAGARRSLARLLARPHFPKGFSYKYPTLNHPGALLQSQENALQVMKKAIKSGEIKKEKRKSKNAPLLKLEKELQKM